MRGKFIPAAAAEREKLDWGGLAWLSRPVTTGAKDLVVIEVSLAPGGGHNFHLHPEQEEVIYVVAGTIEIRLWILSWGDDVEVIAPDELRFDVASTHRRAAARYEPAG